MTLYSSALGGAILGFLFYNFNPASIFMGDTGSMFLGFVLATAATQTNQKSSTAVAVLIPAIALGLPIMDTLLAMGRRALRGRPMFQADKEHIHHRLMAIGLSHRQAVLVLYAFCVILGAVALVMTYANSTQAALLLLGLALLSFASLRALGYLRLDRMSASAAERRRNRALRGAVRPLGRRLRQVRSVDDIWAIVDEAAALFGASGIRVHLGPGASPEETPRSFGRGANGGYPTGSGVFRAHFVVPGGRPEDGLELAWQDGRTEIDRDTEIAIDMLCEYLGEAFDLLKTLPVAGLAASGLEPRA
jgi:UDP-GlcNAc:undecaprenyl-phosphate GlcNAc-1-phosphate transferase